jgi:PAS domain S-box-containing protein
MFSREGRLRLFLLVLVLVLVVVNSQSLQLSHETRSLLSESLAESLGNRARLVADQLALSNPSSGSPASFERLEELALAHGLRSACILDWSSRLLSGGSCEPARGAAFDRLERDGRRELMLEGWAALPVAHPYDEDRAEAVGYLALQNRDVSGESYGVLRVVMAVPSLAAANRRFRTTLVYQVSALSLVLISVVVFFQSLMGAQRKLLAEAKSIATELDRESPEGRDEGQFLLETFQDVVARLKEKEEELRALHKIEKTRADETEALASDIVRSMTTGLVSLDPSGLVAVVNPAAERIFAVEEPSARGRAFGDVFSGSPELSRMVDEALTRGTYHLRGQARYRLSDARTLHLGVSVIPLHSVSGSPRGALCLLADLTEVVELRERLFLRENLARLGEMAAGIAHEFRNGLATIMGNAKLLDTASSSESKEIRDALLAESRSLARVVTEFLQFARPEPLHFEAVDLGDLVDGLVEELRPRADAGGIDVRRVGENVRLEGDELLLRKAFSNLMSNALDSLLQSGAAEGRLSIELTRTDASAVVRVRDNGPGVDPQYREKIFTPFFTLKESGTGLGLSVVQKIVVSHNGTIELEDTSDGASFVVRLPLDPSAGSAAPGIF